MAGGGFDLGVSTIDDGRAPMAERFHFISGLPRSGSTLLAAILRQNPELQANITSPVGAMVSSILGDMSAGNESAVFCT